MIARLPGTLSKETVSAMNASIRAGAPNDRLSQKGNQKL
jgi:hypothetical protein